MTKSEAAAKATPAIDMSAVATEARNREDFKCIFYNDLLGWPIVSAL